VLPEGGRQFDRRAGGMTTKVLIGTGFWHGHTPFFTGGKRSTGGLLKTDQMGHYQPAKDQEVTIAEPGPQRLKKSLYFFGQTRYFNHGWPREEEGRMFGFLFLLPSRPAHKSLRELQKLTWL
jgi:hypothetical protein